MISLQQIENFELLMSADIFKESKKIDDIINSSTSELEIILLSISSYHERDNIGLCNWICEYFPKNKKQRAKCKKYTRATSRSERIWLWKKILRQKFKQNRVPYSKSLEYICKLMMASNHEYPRDFKFESETSNIQIMQYRDNHFWQFVRAYYIFLNSDELKNSRSIFNEKYGFELKDYIYIIYTTVKKFYKLPPFDYFSPYNTSKWKISAHDSDYINVDSNLVRKVLDSISICIDNNSVSDDNPRDTLIFNNRPLLKLVDEKYIPIDGKLLEDTLFHNAFYKFLDLKIDNFQSYFGTAFENYASTLASNCCKLHGGYEFIPEFKYNKNQNKSPDAIIYNPKLNSALVIEVKSAKYLHSLLVRDDNNKSFDETVKKLLSDPWKQALQSISDIVKLKIDNRLNNETSLYFLNVTMNDIAIYPANINIEINGTDVTNRFYSMNIEAFEVFMEILSKKSDFCFASFLNGFNKFRNKLSMKNYLSRVKNGTYNDIEMDNPSFIKIYQEGILDLLNYLDGRTMT